MFTVHRHSDTAIVCWLDRAKEASNLHCSRIPWREMYSWQLTNGALLHRDNHFFSIVGVRASSNDPRMDGLEQPIIVQREIGILGFLVRRQYEHLWFLAQAKTEPGNIGGVQVAPTVQATVSNYSRAHGGSPTPYLEYFLTPSHRIISDSLQSEQGTRFLGKYNRNIMVETDSFTPEPINAFWQWYPWNAIQPLLTADFTINTDARSVLTSSDWHKLSAPEEPFKHSAKSDEFGEKLSSSFHTRQEETRVPKTYQTLARCRQQHSLALGKVSLEQLQGWQMDAWEVKNDRMDFLIQGYKIQVEGREVPTWDQPLICSPEQGEVIFFCQMHGGVLHFLLRTSFEIGFTKRVQFGPSLQLTSQYDHPADTFTQYLKSLFAEKANYQTRLTCLQSDEGGRFYQCTSRYSVIEIDENVHIPIDEGACWVTLGEIHQLAKMQGMLTNEARSAISLLLWYL